MEGLLVRFAHPPRGVGHPIFVHPFIDHNRVTHLAAGFGSCDQGPALTASSGALVSIAASAGFGLAFDSSSQ